MPFPLFELAPLGRWQEECVGEGDRDGMVLPQRVDRQGDGSLVAGLRRLFEADGPDTEEPVKRSHQGSIPIGRLDAEHESWSDDTIAIGRGFAGDDEAAFPRYQSTENEAGRGMCLGQCL